MIKQHFNNQLQKLGYPDGLTIEYSLSCCQGDGMAFYGDLDEDDLEKLMKRIYDTGADENAVRRVKNLMLMKELDQLMLVLRESGMCDVSIDRNSHGQRYSHFNCMDLSHTVEFDEVLQGWDEDESSGLSVGKVTKEQILRWQELWDVFINDLEEDIVSTSQQLESEGYALVGATPYETQTVWEFNTAEYTVQLIEHPEHDLDMGYWDDELEQQTIQDIVDGKQRYLRLEAKILSRVTEEELATDSLGGLVVVIDNDDRSYAGYRRELVSSAVTELRSMQETLAREAA